MEEGIKVNGRKKDDDDVNTCIVYKDSNDNNQEGSDDI